MRYLCLVHADPAEMRRLSPEEKQELDRDSLAYDQALRARGHFIEASALKPAASAKLVRVRKKKAAVTDGPYAETKEVLCGFILIEALDLAEATDIATKI